MKKVFLIALICCLAGSYSYAQEELPISFKPAPPPGDEEPGGGLGCRCPSGDQPVLVQIRWILATCRSHCTRGIGFRCGMDGIIVCRSGQVIVCTRGDNCPYGSGGHREMTAGFTFYDNKTVKLTFQRAMPEEESDRTIFEVEEEVSMNIPDIVLIGGESYSSFRVRAGNYSINYDDGEFGSVILPVELIK